MADKSRAHLQPVSFDALVLLASLALAVTSHYSRLIATIVVFVVVVHDDVFVAALIYAIHFPDVNPHHPPPHPSRPSPPLNSPPPRLHQGFDGLCRRNRHRHRRTARRDYAPRAIDVHDDDDFPPSDMDPTPMA
jgi:hypothetical protein